MWEKDRVIFYWQLIARLLLAAAVITIDGFEINFRKRNLDFRCNLWTRTFFD